MKDAKSGQIMSLPEDCAAREGVFITERMAEELFGTTDAVGKRVRYNDSTFHEVMEYCRIINTGLMNNRVIC